MLIEITPEANNHHCPPITILRKRQPLLETIINDRTHDKVPEAVVDAAEEIMTCSQRNFLETWLPDYLYQKRPVVITKEDRLQNPDVNFEENLANLAIFRDELMEADYPLPQTATTDLEKIKATVATNRVTHAVVKRQTEGVTKALALSLGISVGEVLLQGKFGLNPAAYALASTFDNGLAIIGEVDKLRRQGFSTKEAWETMKIPAGVLAASIATSFLVHNKFEEGQDTLAGALYGAESAICVTTSIASAIFSMRPEYYQLVLEGKVNDPILETLLTKENPGLVDKIKIFTLGSLRALKQDLIYPHHIGLYSGAAVGIVLSAILASIRISEDRTLLQLPFFLGPLGIADSAGGAIAGLTVDRIYDYRLQRDLNHLAN